MNTSFRIIASIATLSMIATACNNGSKVTEDVLAQDSTLVREVMNANRDSISSASSDSLATAIQSGTLSAAPSPAATEPKPALKVEQATSTSAASTSARPRRPAVVRRSSTKVYTPRSKSRAVSVAAATTTAATRRSPERQSIQERQTGPLSQAQRATALVPAGSNIAFTSNDQVCSSTSSVGDTFTARVAEDIIGPLGVVIPKGAVATGQVFTKKNDSRNNSDSDVGVRIQSVTVSGRTYQLASLVTSSDVTEVRHSRNDATKVIAGAGLGAILGRVLGHDTRSTIIGAAGGAATGAVVARQTQRTESCIPDGGRITAKLTEPLRVAFAE